MSEIAFRTATNHAFDQALRAAGPVLLDVDGPVATITINRIGGSEGEATVQFTTSDGTAQSGADYTDSDQTVTFGTGVTSQTVQIPLNNDGSDEFNETILLALQNASGAFLGTPYRPLSYETLVDDFVAALPSAAHAERIMRDNAERLYGF